MFRAATKTLKNMSFRELKSNLQSTNASITSMTEFPSSYAHSRLCNISIGSTLEAVKDSTSSTSKPTFIGTHDGSFHCDEALACALLRHTRAYKHAGIVRTRSEDALKQCSIVVDVGGTYDVAAQRYDHHQNSFQETMDTGVNKYKTRMSSAGLVYKHFGREIVNSYQIYCAESEHYGFGDPYKDPSKDGTSLTQNQLDLVYDRVYKNFVEHVDGIDNGVEQFCFVNPQTSAKEGPPLTQNYSVTSSLSSRIGRLYPAWNDPNNGKRDFEDAAFVQAMHLAATEFFEALEYTMCSWLPARSIVEQAVDAAEDIDASKQILCLNKGGCPWKEHLLDIEKERGFEGRTLYVLYQDTKGGWRVQCVPKEGSMFENRKPLPWKGLREAELDKASGIDGGVFVHASGFIGGNKTFEGAKKMAVKALSEM